jgi:CBS domain containing-hemolysin-like protein
MSWVVVAGIILAGLFMSGFFSGAETGLYCVNRLRLQIAVQQNDMRASRLSRLLADEQGALSATLIGTNLMNYLTTTAVAFLFAELLQLNHVDSQLYTIVLVTPIVFVFGEVVPKNLFQRHPDMLMLRVAWMLSASSRVFRSLGAVPLVSGLARLANRLASGSVTRAGFVEPKRRVALLLQEALVDQTHGEDRSEMIDRVCRLSETPVRDVMIPFRRVTSIAATATRRQLVRLARATGYARLPVHGARQSRITGLVKLDELLRDRDWSYVGERLVPALAIGPHDSVASAINRMRAEKREMAIVTGPGDHLLGIVTLRDLFQELIGEQNGQAQSRPS